MRTLIGSGAVESLEAWHEADAIKVRVRLRSGVHVNSVTTGLLRYMFGGYLDPFTFTMQHTEVDFLEVEQSNPITARSGELELAIPAGRVARGMLWEYETMGTIVAPGLKVDLKGRPDVVVMLMRPPGPDARIVADKSRLTASSGDGWAFAGLESSPSGGLRIEVTSGGRGFSGVKVEVRRSVEWCPMYTTMLNEISQVEKIASFEPGSPGVVEWRPDYPVYEPFLAALSTQPSYDEILRLLDMMGIEARRDLFRMMIVLGRPHYVLADLKPVRTKLRVCMSRRLRRDVVDETELRLEGLE
ncbi:MAG: hypothetical protein QW490_02595 [Nitrososphaerota archaeon]|nr:hypothetical protein [Candidatus Calditenuis fumarioli]